MLYILYLLLVLILLASFGKDLNKYNCAITSLLTILLVSYFITRNLQKSLLLSVFITILLSLIKCPISNQLEFFDSDITKDDLNLISNSDTPEATTEHNDNKDDDKNDDVGDDDDDDDDIDDFKKLKGSIEGLHNTPKSLHINPSKNSYENYTPARAQRETFKLINSVKALQNTMTELVPNLSAAKQVLDLYKVIKH